MSDGVRCRFDGVRPGGGAPVALEMVAPAAVVEARAASDVRAVLDEVEEAARRGWYAVGFVAYEAAPGFDPALRVRPPEPEGSLPLAWFGLFPTVSPADPLPPPALVPSEDGGAGPSWRAEIDAAAHAAAVGAVRSAIAAGDTYLVNLTTRFRRPWAGGDDSFSLYRRLVAGHAGGCHLYLETPRWAVACGSPELFFELTPDRLETRPMKGTAPRGRWSAEDRVRADALGHSVKERAENVMVVDLLRNDIGRVSRPGTVVVPSLWRVERHPSVWQLSSTVVGRPRPGVGLSDVFGALFPCGSVTGAPKVSTMAHIARHERSPRGVYCGAVGLVEPAGARFAVAIRTATVDKVLGMATYGSGGGITWDSAAEAEWEEVRLKTGVLEGRVPVSARAGGLIETMVLDPVDRDGPDAAAAVTVGAPATVAVGVATGAGCGIRDLEAHLARLDASAAYLGFARPRDARRAVAAAVAGVRPGGGPARIRLVAGRDGSVEVEVTSLAGGATGAADGSPARLLSLCVDPEPVDPGDAGLFHKTTDRRRYDERADRHPHADDVVLVNRRGEVTETTRANLAVRVGAEWWTPPLDCGLLPGVARARLIGSGRVVERVVTVGLLREATEVATCSSLRGWRPARVLAVCPDG